MEIFQVTKESLRFIFKRFTKVLVVCFIALPVLFMVSMMSSNSKFDLTAVPGVKVENDTALGLDTKYESSQPTSIPEGRLFDDTLAYGYDSQYDSSQSTSTPDSKLLNRTLAPSFDKVSDFKYESSQPISTPDDKLLKRTLAPTFDGGSVSRNESSQPTTVRNENVLNGNLAPKFSERSGSRNDSSQASSNANDILLDGLICPGFDERSCLSRRQSILYRRTSPHKPSPFLLSKLRNYENLHKRCGPYTKSYNKTLKTLKSGHINSATECKYIVWRPDNGLGNRIVSMASSFLYALLTNRVLLVDHGADMTDLFCEPFPNSSWLLPMDFPLRNQFRNSELRYAHSFGGMLEKDGTSVKSTPSYLYLFLKKRDYDLDKKLFYCDQNQSLLQKVPWLILLSEQYFAPSFFLIQSFKEEVTRLFPEKDTVFYHLGRYLFNPSNQVWEQLITKFYDAYLAKADKRIGLQIRLFHANTAMFQTVMDQILTCTVKKKILPDVSRRNSAASSSRSWTSSKAILVTSLYTEFYKNLSSMYGDKAAVKGEVMGVYQPSHEGYQHRGDNLHNMKAWAEIYLLSLCDVLVTSAWSTFGYVAHGLGGLKPWILHKPGHGMYLPCKQAMSMEPCFHYPFSYDCKSKKNVDPGTLVPHIKQCEDRELGVKLFNDDH
ncbi:galactoside 2-alpha-L-fucosyltransferase isoform X1 [Ricinus communis]|uniref:galactoside 2-alpha-L-fucosyltransferase isoform X1 n=1 Tax=Ricinus communis TaxID=3988 RepID=UPI00201A917E|nr:galactoside 2-alpha-L-fucosyltransferase isoform X1 [Ricinus communis]XP_048234424.1 galactoside 2-alpha-L-fucosyltransferase isoform X1 [Ricinus communis]